MERRLVIVTLRRGQQGLLSGRAQYRLIDRADGLRIRGKSVRLLERDHAFDNLTFLP